MVNKSEFIWNTIGSIFASALSAVLLMFVNRINGEGPAGLFSIVFATATILNAIADYGMRVYQVTDTKRNNSFSVYLKARLLVVTAMLLVGIVTVILLGYPMEKAVLCLFLVGFRFVDGVSETFQGEFQLNGRLDRGGKSVAYRMFFAILVFGIVDKITGNLLIACGSMTLANGIVFWLYDLRLIKQYAVIEKAKEDKEKIIKIIKDCFPLFISTFLNLYIINAPKYAIDAVLSYEMQNVFSIIYLPTFTINLMSIFVLKPMLRSLGEMWNTGDYKKFQGIVWKMMGVILILTLLVEAAGYLLGIPVLSLIYKTELAAYRGALLILVLSGGFNALSVVLFYGLTTMRCQNKSIIPYTMAALVGLFASKWLTKAFQLTGAALSSVAIMGTLFVGLFILFQWEQHRLTRKHVV